MTDTDRLPVEPLTNFVPSLLQATGLRGEDARLCAEAFVLQEMRGVTTHGLRRVKSNVDQLLAGRLKVDARYEVLNDDGATALIDGHGGIGIATVRNNTHFLAAAPYCLRAVEAGQIEADVRQDLQACAAQLGVPSPLK